MLCTVLQTRFSRIKRQQVISSLASFRMVFVSNRFHSKQKIMDLASINTRVSQGSREICVLDYRKRNYPDINNNAAINQNCGFPSFDLRFPLRLLLVLSLHNLVRLVPKHHFYKQRNVVKTDLSSYTQYVQS